MAWHLAAEALAAGTQFPNIQRDPSFGGREVVLPTAAKSCAVDPSRAARPAYVAREGENLMLVISTRKSVLAALVTCNCNVKIRATPTDYMLQLTDFGLWYLIPTFALSLSCS